MAKKKSKKYIKYNKIKIINRNTESEHDVDLDTVNLDEDGNDLGPF